MKALRCCTCSHDPSTNQAVNVAINGLHIPASISRRQYLLEGAATFATTSVLSVSAPSARAAPSTPPPTTCPPSRTISPAFTTALVDSCTAVAASPTYRNALETVFTREYRYFVLGTGETSRLTAQRTLSDVLMKGALPRECELLMYSCYKALAEAVPVEGRTAACRQIGQRMVAALVPKDAVVGGARAAVDMVLQELCAQGFACRYVLAWGSLPTLLQVDSTGIDADQEDSSSSSSSSSSSDDSIGEVGDADEFVFQVKLYDPADIIGATALRGETDGWSGQLVGNMVLSALQRAGHANAYWDEYFLQDQWVPPPSAVDRVLLFFGDPLMTVQVPWEPTTLVQDWTMPV